MPDQPFRHPLAALRADLGLTAAQYLDSLDRAHAFLGKGHMSLRREKVSRWESGVNVPDQAAQLAMAQLHGIPPEAVNDLGWPHFLLLAFPDDRPILYSPWTPAGTVAAVAAAAREGAMDRRGFLISTGAALGMIATRWSRAVSDLPTPSMTSDIPSVSSRQLTASTVTRLEQRVDDLRHLDDVLGGEELRPSALAEYRLLDRLAQQAGDDVLGQQLFSTLAEAARICGWLHFDAGLHAAAQGFYVTSLRASASAHDPEVGANTLNYMAIQTYSEGNPQDAVNLIRTAQEQVVRRTTPRVRSLLHARAGRALSKTGDRTGCARAFDAARTDFAAGPHDDDPPWAYSITEGEIEMLAGSSALDLHQPRQALAHFAAARAAEYATSGHLRDGALYLTRAAQAHLDLGDLDAACDAATDALTQNSSTGASRPSEAIADLRSKMAPYRNVRAVNTFLGLSA